MADNTEESTAENEAMRQKRFSITSLQKKGSFHPSLNKLEQEMGLDQTPGYKHFLTVGQQETVYSHLDPDLNFAAVPQICTGLTHYPGSAQP